MDDKDVKQEAHVSGTRGVRPEAQSDAGSQVQERTPANAGKRKRVAGPGAADASGRPKDTATPGGALGTASYEELTEDPEDASSASDDRMATDER
jgi:hypothetical protein